MTSLESERECLLLETSFPQQECLAAVGQRAAGVVHEFNNIVSAIGLYAGLIEAQRSLDETGQSYLNAIRVQVERGASLVWEILDLAQRAPLERVEVDVVSFVNGLLPLLRRTLPIGVVLVVHGDAGACIVSADPTGVQQILVSLVSNAKDAFHGPGQITITVSCGGPTTTATASAEGAFDGAWVRIDVADTGRGIPAENLERVFDPFFSTKSPGQGSGLGLSQVRAIVNQHEGHIEIDSSGAGGTTVAVTLRGVDHAAISARMGWPQVHRGSGERVLVVDDDAALREALSRVIESLGYEVTLVADAEEAVAHLEKASSATSAVVSDIIMPGIGGEGLAGVIAERWPALPVILVSGSPPSTRPAAAAATTTEATTTEATATVPMPARVRREGGLVRLVKPFTKTDLAEALRVVVRPPA